MEVREMAMAAASGGGGAKLPPPNPNLPYREDCWSDGGARVRLGQPLRRAQPRQPAPEAVAGGGRRRQLSPRGIRAPPPAAHRRAVQEPRRHPQEEVQGRARPQRPLRLVLLPRPRPPRWPYPHRLRIQEAAGASTIRPARPPPAHKGSLPLLPCHRRPRLRLWPCPCPIIAAGLLSQQEAAAAAAAAMSDDEDSDDAGGNNNNNPQQSPPRSVSSLSGHNKKRSRHEPGSRAHRGFGELATAIEAFAEMYERVESAKQKRALEMERQRIDFLKQLELKRMEHFVDAHVKLMRTKRAKKGGGGGAAGVVELVATLAALPFVSTSTFH